MASTGPTTTTPCVYQSITLSAGEQFILPPGAEIVMVSNSAALTSENDCLVIPPETTYKCYMFQFLASGEQVDDESADRAWESFTYGGYTASFDVSPATPKTSLGWDWDTLCQNNAEEIWNKIQAHDQLKVFVTGVKVIGEGWNAGDQYGVVIRVADLFDEVPIMQHIDKNNYNLLGNTSPNQMRTQSIGVEVECSTGDNLPKEPNDSCYKSYGTF